MGRRLLALHTDRCPRRGRRLRPGPGLHLRPAGVPRRRPDLHRCDRRRGIRHAIRPCDGDGPPRDPGGQGHAVGPVEAGGGGLGGRGRDGSARPLRRGCRHGDVRLDHPVPRDARVPALPGPTRRRRRCRGLDRGQAERRRGPPRRGVRRRNPPPEHSDRSGPHDRRTEYRPAGRRRRSRRGVDRHRRRRDVGDLGAGGSGTRIPPGIPRGVARRLGWIRLGHGARQRRVDRRRGGAGDLGDVLRRHRARSAVPHPDGHGVGALPRHRARCSSGGARSGWRGRIERT